MAHFKRYHFGWWCCAASRSATSMMLKIGGCSHFSNRFIANPFKSSAPAWHHKHHNNKSHRQELGLIKAQCDDDSLTFESERRFSNHNLQHIQKLKKWSTNNLHGIKRQWRVVASLTPRRLQKQPGDHKEVPSKETHWFGRRGGKSWLPKSNLIFFVNLTALHNQIFHSQNLVI